MDLQNTVALPVRTCSGDEASSRAFPVRSSKVYFTKNGDINITNSHYHVVYEAPEFRTQGHKVSMIV
jgi:hypothetical protein